MTIAIVKDKYAFKIPISQHYGEVVETNINSFDEKEIRLKTDLRYTHDSINFVLEKYYNIYEIKRGD